MSPLGFSAADVLDAFEGAHVSAFAYCDASPATELTVSSFYVRAAMKAFAVSEPRVASLGGTYAYPTADGPIRGPGSVQMLVRLSPECGVYGRFTLINAAPYHDAWFDVGRF